MTENKEKMPEKGPLSQKKKWLWISLCSAALLGGAVGYGIYNNQSSNQSNQKIEALCQMMLVKRNLRIIGDQVDQFLLIFFS